MSQFPQKKGELLQSAGDEGWTVYEAGSDSLHVLNDSARAIWELCDGETAPEEMAEALANITQLDRASATDEVAEALRSLNEAGLVVYEE